MCCAVLSHSVVPDSLRLYGLKPARLLCPWGFSRQEYCSGLPCPPPRELPNPGIKPRSSALQADSLPAEPPRKAQEYWSWYLSLLQQIFQTQESNLGLLHCRQILYQLSYQGSPSILEWLAYPFSSRSSRPRNWITVSCIAGKFFTNELSGKPRFSLVNIFVWDSWVIQ